MQQPAGLISVLLDDSARIDERDDAAIDLADFDEDEAERALLKVAQDPSAPNLVLSSCGEALAEIWCRKYSALPKSYSTLTADAKQEARAFIESAQPEWLR